MLPPLASGNMEDWYMTGVDSFSHNSQPFYPFANTITQQPLVPLQSLPQTHLFQPQDYNSFQARNPGIPLGGFDEKRGVDAAWKMNQNVDYHRQPSPILQHQQNQQMMRPNMRQEFFQDIYGVQFYFPQAFDTACITTDRESLYDLNQERHVASNDFAPSRPLSLLMEPATINLRAHARKIRRVYLGYWDDHEPDGRRIQREMEEHERRCKRDKVKSEAAVADLINLTFDEG